MADCNKCASASSCERVWKGMSNPMCVGFEPIRTNADRIRNMMDEELVNFLRKHPWYGHGRVYADDELLDWLQQEAKE